MKSNIVDIGLIVKKIDELNRSEGRICNKVGVGIEEWNNFLNGKSMLKEVQFKELATFLKVDVEEIVNLEELRKIGEKKRGDIKLKETCVVTVFNNKGGVGKTTITMMAGRILANMGYKVLIFSLDAQCDITALNAMAVGNNTNKAYIEELITPGTDKYGQFEGNVCETSVKNLHFVKGRSFVASYVENNATNDEKLFMMKTAMKDLIESQKYDFIFIDNNGALDLAAKNIFMVAKFVIVPVTKSKMSLEGVKQTCNFMRRFFGHSSLMDWRIVLNDINSKTNASKENESEIRELYQGQVFSRVIREDATIENMDVDIIPDGKNGRGVKAYADTKAVCWELIKIIKELDEE